MSSKLSAPTFNVDSNLRNKLVKHLPSLSGKKILVIGDVGLDEYIMGDVRRISPEAPVPVLEVRSEDSRLGLAANVALNIQTLGGTPLLISVIGNDAGAESLKFLMQKKNVNSDHLVSDAQRPTTRKARILAKGHHIVRVDYEERKFLSEKTAENVLRNIEKVIDQADALIVEDYAKGVVTPQLFRDIVALAKKKNKKILVDPHQTNKGEFYSGVDLIKPNFDEALALSGLNYDDLRDHPNKVLEVGRALQQKTGAVEIVMTRGKEGMTIFSGDSVVQVPTFARQVFDVTGAGDTVIAAIAMGLTSGLPLQEACVLANFAAGVVVGQIGCVPCTIAELREAMSTE